MGSAGDQEVAQLDKVLTRLALTEEGGLEKVLSKLLPVVIGELKSSNGPTRNKVLEILSHVNKRIKGHNDIKLPLEDLVDLYRSSSLPLVRNFALVYVEMAFSRTDSKARLGVVSKLLESLAGGTTSEQRDMLLRMAVAGLEALAGPPQALAAGKEADFAAQYPFLALPGPRQLFLDFALKVLLYVPPASLSRNKPRRPARPPTLPGLPSGPFHVPPQQMPTPQRQGSTAEGGRAVPPPEIAAAPVAHFGLAGAAAQLAGDPEPDKPLVPPGLCPNDVAQVEGKVAQVEGKEPPTEGVLVARKLGILNFTAAAGMPPREVLMPYLAAAASPFQAVASRGEELARKRCGVDSMKPEVDLEDAALIGQLFRAFLGTRGSLTEGAAPPEPECRQPVNPVLQTRLLSLFCRSIAAANSFPLTLLVIQASVFADEGPSRLRVAGMHFAVWAFKHAARKDLATAAPEILDKLLEALESEHQNTELTGFIYQAIGQLAERVPEAVQDNVSLVSLFFSRLSSEQPVVRGYMLEALPSLARAYQGCSGSVSDFIHDLLLNHIDKEDWARQAAIQWANRFYPFCAPAGRYLAVLAAGDSKLEVREAGLAGLKPPRKAEGEDDASATLPSATTLVMYVLKREPGFRKPADPNGKLKLAPKSFLALLGLVRQCWQEDRRAHATLLACSGELEQLPDVPDVVYQGFLGIVEHALVREAPADLHVAALESMLELAAEFREQFSNRYAARLSLFTPFLGHVDASARDIAAKLVAMVASGLPLTDVEPLLKSHVATVGAIKGSRLEDRLGSISVLGYLLAQIHGAPPELMSAAVAHLCTALRDSSSLVASTAAAALGHAGLERPLPLPLGELHHAETRSPQSPAGEDAGADGKAGDAPVGTAQDTEDTRFGVLARLTALMSSKDIKVAAQAAVAAGQLAAGDEALLPELWPALCGLASNKSEELQFAVGEALSWSFGGVLVSPSVVLHTNFRSLTISLLSAAADELGDPAGPSDTEGTMVADATSPIRRAAQEDIVSKLLGEMVLYNSKDEVRAAGCVWLVSLLSFTRGSGALASRLSEIQSALTQLLGHSSELVQEMASRGLSVVYSLAGPEGRKDLLENLMGTLQGTRKRRAVKIEGSTRVFEEGAVELPSGGSLTTYKELCALATDLGQPDLLYKFMDLANHAASLQSSRGAAFGFASIAKLAGEQLTPYVNLLIPKLYRYQYDPKPQVRDAMIYIWRTLVAEPKQAIDANFKEILDLLLKEMGGNLWRVRESACLALADLLQGRRWDDVKARFEDIWVMAFRVSDDVKESTRAAGATAVRTVRSLALRVCDPAASSSTADALKVVLPFLLQRVSATSIAEERAVALTVLASLAKNAAREDLRGHLGDLVPVMLESLSGMEDERLNYLEQHTERLGIDGGRLETLRVSAARSSPMGETLDICARVADANSIDALVPKLAALVKRGVGLNTRAGTARFIGLLSQRLGTALGPSCGTLISALMAAAAAESSSAVRRAYATAVGQVARVSPEPRIAKLASDALSLHSSPGDRAARLVSGMVVKELMRQAPEQFQGHAAAVLPLAFVARSDEEADVATVWSEVWEEGGTSLRLYVPDIVPLVLRDVQSQQWGRKAAAAKAVVSLCKGAPDALKQYSGQLVHSLVQELPGRLWSGKEAVLEAVAAMAQAAPADVPADEVVTALLTAAQRKSASFRKAALGALETALGALPGDHLRSVGPVLLRAVSAHAVQPPSRASTPADGEEGEEGERPPPLLECIKCLKPAWAPASVETLTALAQPISESLRVPLAPEQPWAVRAAGLACVKDLMERLSVSDASCGGSSREGGPSEYPGDPVRMDPATVGMMAAQLVPGLLSGLDELRISQVRGAALDALSAVFEATSGPASLPPDLVRAIDVRLSELISSERIPSIKAQASALQQRLPNNVGEGSAMA